MIIFESMRKFTYVLMTILLFSCGDSAEPQDEENTDVQEENETTIDSTFVVEEVIDSNEVEIFVEDMPRKWVMLTNVGDQALDLVVYDYCFSERLGRSRSFWE